MNKILYTQQTVTLKRETVVFMEKWIFYDFRIDQLYLTNGISLKKLLNIFKCNKNYLEANIILFPSHIQSLSNSFSFYCKSLRSRLWNQIPASGIFNVYVFDYLQNEPSYNKTVCDLGLDNYCHPFGTKKMCKNTHRTKVFKYYNFIFSCFIFCPIDKFFVPKWWQ